MGASTERKIAGAAAIVLQIGLIAGTLDIGENLIFNALRHITPAMVFRYIASGLIGRAAFRGGVASIALGVAIHYSIALVWTAVYYAASRRMAVLTLRPVLCGILYGAAVYLFMNWIVLPLTRVPQGGRRDDLGVAHQRSAGVVVLHWADHCAAGAARDAAGTGARAQLAAGSLLAPAFPGRCGACAS